MANQIVVSAGAKVRNLQDVIIGTSGVLTSLGFDVANGVPRLDVNGKILVSQLPNSVMEYKGTWSAATNTPTLVNGTGNQGDVYLCNVAGTVNFGAGPIAFVVGDQVIYSGSIWQRASGATGTVTSVAVTESGDSLNITGSPITTSGTINIGFNGTNLQYVNGAGNLTTFPTLITSIGLTMPSAFSVANSPLTANGTIAVTGAGVASQYIRGDGTLADFPSSGGGGSSVSYYLNGGTSQGTIGGVTYYEMSKTAVIGTGVDFTKTGDGFIVAFLTDANDPAQLNIPAGNWNYEIYASMSSNGGTPEMYAELYKYDGTTFTLIATSPHEILYDGTALNLYTFAMAVPATSLTLTDRLAVKLYATNSGGKTTTIHTQDGHLCQIITTFSTGITALNGLTAQVQYFQTGTSGTDFNISSTTATHTFNIPDASATARGLITTGTQTIAGTKTFSDATKNNGGIFLQNASSSSLAGYMNIGGLTNGVKFTSGGGVSNTFTLPSATGYTFTFPNANGTIALTSDISYPVTSVFGRTGAVVATSGDYTTAQVTESGNLYYTDTRSRLALSFAAGMGAYNSATGVITIPTNNNQITNGSNYIALTSLSVIGPLLYDNTTGVFNINQASTTVSGWVSFTDFTTFNNKQNALTLTTTGTSGAATLVGATLNIPQYTDAYTGTVTSVAALTLGTSGTDLSSSVANSTTTPVITLNVPTASATNRGALASADWTTFNNKQGTITLTTTGTSGAATFSANTLNIPNYAPDLSGYVTLATTQTISGAKTFSANILANTKVLINSTDTTKTPLLLNAEGNYSASGNMTSGFAITNTSFGRALNMGIYESGAYGWIQSAYINNADTTFALALQPRGGNVLIGTTDDGGKVVSYTTNAATQFKAAGTAPAITFSNTVLSPTIGGVLGVCTAANHFFTGTASSDMVLANQFSAGALIFGTSNVERMRISVGGNVGIGDTGAASYRLSVTNSGAGGIVSNASGGGDAGFLSSSTTIGYHFYGLSGTAKFYVVNGGAIHSTSATITLITSDRNLKTDIVDYDKGLSEVLAMKPRYYKYKDNLHKQEIGFIAQEMDEALKGSMIDSIVKNKETSENYKTYQLEWYPLLVNAIKEQQKQIEELKLKIK